MASVRRWIGVIAVVGIGLGASACSDSTDEPGALQQTVALAPFPTIGLETPSSWNAVDDWAFNRDPCPDAGCTAADTAMAVLFWRVTQLYGDPCSWIGTAFDPGPSVDDLASALQSIPTRSATVPVPVTVDGVEGLYLEWSVPDGADFPSCDEGVFESWKGDVGGTDRYQQLPGQVDRLWILDVDGERLVINAFFLPATPEEDRREIDEIIASIEFGRAG